MSRPRKDGAIVEVHGPVELNDGPYSSRQLPHCSDLDMKTGTSQDDIDMYRLGKTQQLSVGHGAFHLFSRLGS